MAKALMSSYIHCKVSSIWKIIPSKLFSISGSYFHIQIAVIVILFPYSESTGEALAAINLSQQECFIRMTLRLLLVFTGVN